MNGSAVLLPYLLVQTDANKVPFHFSLFRQYFNANEAPFHFSLFCRYLNANEVPFHFSLFCHYLNRNEVRVYLFILLFCRYLNANEVPAVPFRFVVLSIFGCKQSTFCQYLNADEVPFHFQAELQGCGHVGALFTNEEQKTVARNVFHTFARHADFLHDVTDT